VQDFAVENLRNQPHTLVVAELPAVAGNNSRAFLAAVLQGIKSVIGQLSGVGMTINAEDAAVMLWVDAGRVQLLDFKDSKLLARVLRVQFSTNFRNAIKTPAFGGTQLPINPKVSSVNDRFDDAGCRTKLW
jgi:hypothetical protein